MEENAVPSCKLESRSINYYDRSFITVEVIYRDRYSRATHMICPRLDLSLQKTKIAGNCPFTTSALIPTRKRVCDQQLLRITNAMRVNQVAKSPTVNRRTRPRCGSIVTDAWENPPHDSAPSANLARNCRVRNLFFFSYEDVTKFEWSRKCYSQQLVNIREEG